MSALLTVLASCWRLCSMRSRMSPSSWGVGSSNVPLMLEAPPLIQSPILPVEEEITEKLIQPKKEENQNINCMFEDGW